MKHNKITWLLALCMFFSGYCGILAELSLFTLAETLIGGTIQNMLITMGVMMFFMGVGSWIAGWSTFRNPSFSLFISLELILSISVSIAIPTLTWACGSYAFMGKWLFGIYSGVIGTLIGMEIPVMQKLLQKESQDDIQVIASRVMMVDYFGSLLGFVLFSLLLLHTVGIAMSSFSGGVINLFIASLVLLARPNQCHTLIKVSFGIVCLMQLGLGLKLKPIMLEAEQNLYHAKITWRKQTPYQNLVLTDNSKKGTPEHTDRRYRDWKREGKVIHQFDSIDGKASVEQFKDKSLSLFINGGLQFNSLDEHYYHESMVHPAMMLHGNVQNVLIMGGGDGLALREVLKHKAVKKATLIDLDQEMINAFSQHKILKALNQNAYQDPRVHIITGDAWTLIREQRELFDLILLDFPDPHHSQTAKLYSKQFYTFCKLSLKEKGILVTQSTSPMLDRKAFVCIHKTLKSAGFSVVPSHVEMPSFLQWGFQIASLHMNTEQMKEKLNSFNEPFPLNFLDRDAVRASILWPKNTFSDLKDMPVNDFQNLVLLELYHKDIP